MTRNRDTAAAAFMARRPSTGGTVTTDGHTIWSYGKHFPMARHCDFGRIEVNQDGYSRTTSQHQAALRREIEAHGYRPTDETVESGNDLGDYHTYRVYRRER